MTGVVECLLPVCGIAATGIKYKNWRLVTLLYKGRCIRRGGSLPRTHTLL